MVQLSHPSLTFGKNIALTIWIFVGKVMSLLFNMLSRLFITFLPRSKPLLISRLQSPSAEILEPKKIKPVTVSIVSASICHEVMGPDATILVFWMLNFKPAFSLSSFTFIKRLFSSSLSAIRVVSSAYLGLLLFLPALLIQLVFPPAQRFSWCTLHQVVFFLFVFVQILVWNAFPRESWFLDKMIHIPQSPAERFVFQEVILQFARHFIVLPLGAHFGINFVTALISSHFCDCGLSLLLVCELWKAEKEILSSEVVYLVIPS